MKRDIKEAMEERIALDLESIKEIDETGVFSEEREKLVNEIRELSDILANEYELDIKDNDLYENRLQVSDDSIKKMVTDIAVPVLTIAGGVLTAIITSNVQKDQMKQNWDLVLTILKFEKEGTICSTVGRNLVGKVIKTGK